MGNLTFIQSGNHAAFFVNANEQRHVRRLLHICHKFFGLLCCIKIFRKQNNTAQMVVSNLLCHIFRKNSHAAVVRIFPKIHHEHLPYFFLYGHMLQFFCHSIFFQFFSRFFHSHFRLFLYCFFLSASCEHCHCRCQQKGH